MDLFTRDTLKHLMEPRPQPRVSLYLPTHRSLPDTMQDPIRFKNLLGVAERQLEEEHGKSVKTNELLKPARDLLQDFTFWQHQGDGLACFLAPGFFVCYRLPITFEELLIVGEHFHVKPVLPLLSGDGEFYLLALSQKDVRLFRGTKLAIRELDLKNIPKSVEASLPDDIHEKQLQFHTRVSGPSGDRNSVTHGHGANTEDNKEDITRFFRQIDKGLRDVLRGETAPLLVAGIEYLHPLYKAVNTYSDFVDEPVITGNPDGLSDEELHRDAWRIVAPRFEKSRSDAMERFSLASGKGMGASRIEEILPASGQGRVDTLFAAIGTQEWGRFDSEKGTVVLDTEPFAGNEDLINLAAVQTILSGGQVFAMKQEAMPMGHSIAAIFRYA